MKRRLLHLVVALMAFAATTMAQSLSVAPIEATPGTETTITVNIAGAAEMTALQFNLSLPEGFTLAGDITLGSAAQDHTMSISPLASGDLLVVIYSLNQGTFADGALLTIPVIAAEDAASGEARLYTVRTATVDAVSRTLSDVAFAMNVASTPDGIEQLTTNQSQLTIYDLTGRRVEKAEKGIYIVNGKKVVIK